MLELSPRALHSMQFGDVIYYLGMKHFLAKSENLAHLCKKDTKDAPRGICSLETVLACPTCQLLNHILHLGASGVCPLSRKP